MEEVSSPNLTPVSHLILGFVSAGATTPYALKQKAARSVGYFWSFPHSQFYSEPPRLVELGLLEERREETGRRRRHYTITDAGRAALDAWLREPTSEQPQIRDTGLLKLFFAEGLRAEEVAALAIAQVAAHRERLAVYEAIDELMPDEAPGAAFHRATLRMGLLCEQAFIEFWSEVAARPPGTPERGAAAAREPAPR